MSLRTRLIIAFLLLSVVPLTAVTAISYTSWVAAFEAAARREATESAVDISRRMEIVTADVGRRMDQLFVRAPVGGDQTATTSERMREHVAGTLGDAAALVERVEFHPMPEPEGTGGVEAPLPPPPPPPAPTAAPKAPPAPRVKGTPAVPPVAPTPPAPSTPPVMVFDVAKVMAEARRSAREATAIHQPEMAAIVEKALDIGLPAAEASMKAVAEALTKSASSHKQAMQNLQLHVEGRKIEVAVKKDGKMIGKANATLNLERAIQTVLSFARRDQGEIAFALDRSGGLYTPEPTQKRQLEALNVAYLAPLAAEGKPRRHGDWMVVARKEPGGLIFGIARPIGESLREIRNASMRSLSLGLVAIGLALVGIVPISHRMTRHLSSLTAGVRQLASGDFHARVNVKSADEFGTLARAFNQMAEDLEKNQALAVEQERLHRELELSRQIQTEMLPRTRLQLGPAEIKGVSIPAREVGGDFFNYFVLPDGLLGLLVGDVSGKGVSAALLMANVQATLRARLPLDTDLAKLAADLDREIDATTPRGVYLTLFMGILDTGTGLLRYVNAGHHPQFVMRTGGGIEPMTSTGLPIALYPDHGYKEASTRIGAGDLLFFYTDGLVEAEDASGDMFGADRLQTLLAAERAEGIDTLLEHVEETVRRFRGSVESFDDATMMALRLNG
jgi:serine phosphatase RsbU (regulator of sigma subunit)